MRRKLIALFTAVMVLTGYSLPAFAEEIAEPESVITVDSDIAADSETTDENGDVMEGSDSEEDADTSADADAEATAAPDEDITGETVTDTAETTEETVETAVPETEEAETAEAAETTDAAAEETEELLEEEQELNTNLPAWVKSWDNSTGTLTLQGQLPDTYYDENTSTEYGLAELAGIYNSEIKEIIVTNGTKAGSSTAYMFFNLCNLTEIEGLENLDTSNATDMNHMFSDCSSLKSLDLSSFDTSKVTNMSFMFFMCSNLTTINVSDKWSTDNVTYSGRMFASCKKLKGGMGTVFEYSKDDKTYARVDGGALRPGYLSSDTVIVTYPAWIKSWDIENGVLTIQGQLPDTSIEVYTLKNLAYHAGIRNDAVKKIVVTSGTKAGVSAEGMFSDLDNLTGIQGLTNLDTSNVTDMSFMFYGCSSLTSLDLSSFNTSNVTDMSYMFDGCKSLTSLDLLSFSTSNVTNMAGMFGYCKILTAINVSDKWNTDKVTESGGMFYGCEYLRGGKGTRYNSSITDKTYARADGGTSSPGYFISGTVTYPDWVKSWDPVNGVLTLQGQLPETFYFDDRTCRNLAFHAGIDGSKIKKIVVTSGTKTDNIAESMFRGLNNLTEIQGLSNLDISDVTNMQFMFADCSSLTTLDLSGFDTSNVTDMAAMFSGCSSLTTITVSDKWNTDKVTKSGGMFYGCIKLKGGAGTTYDSSKTDKTYARIDKPGQPGYLTAKSNLPAKPVISSLTPSAASVTVKWNAVSGATSYRVYRKTGTNVTFLKEVTATSYTDTGLKSGTKYGYLVRAFNSAGGTAYTDTDWKFATPTGPATLAKPTFTVTAGDKSVTVKWNAVSGATSYRVYQKNGTAVKFLKEVTTTSYTDTGLTNGTKYGYLVRAFAGTTGTNYTDADWKYATPVAALAKPTFTVTAGNASVTVKWNAVSGATSYRVYRKTGTSVAFLKEVTTLTYTDTGLTNGTKYGYLVRAFKGTTGTGYTDADWKFATPAAATTLAKPVFTATAATGSATVKWSAVSGAASYRVYRMDGTTVKFLKEVTTLTYSDTTVTNGTKYGYLVRAFKGTTGSAYTNADFKYVTPLAKPAVTLTAGTKQVTVKWNKVTGATSYRVYRIDGSAITALTNTTGTSYTATGLTTGTKYGFTVRAFNGNDASTYASTDVVYTTAK